MDLLTLAAFCGPLVDPAMTLRVIAVESAGHAYAIHDNTTGVSYDSATAAGAEGIANLLLKAGHRIDLGLMQISYDAWLRPTGFAVVSALDPCTNIRLGTTLLSANYAHALKRPGTSVEALARALSEYNSGSQTRAWSYAVQVLTGRTALKLLGNEGPRRAPSVAVNPNSVLDAHPR
jgi:type IV secretion system protein VirB1